MRRLKRSSMLSTLVSKTLPCPPEVLRMKEKQMGLAVVAPLAEAVPPMFYGGKE
jgi:hypothetical protein